MASIDHVNRRANGTKNLKVHFELPECEDRHQRDSISSTSSDSSLGSADTQKITTQSPTTQMMGRPGYDPNRIPLAVFSTKPTNPMEWSLASNESLFSLHIGNISFSTDNAFGLKKSGELPRLDECISMSVERNSVSIDTLEEITDVVEEKKYDTILETSAETATVTGDEVRNSTAIFHRSEESKMLYTNGSFHFPVLTGEGDGGRNSSGTEESQKQKTEKPVEPYSPKITTAPNPGRRNLCHCFCFCSPCY